MVMLAIPFVFFINEQQRYVDFIFGGIKCLNGLTVKALQPRLHQNKFGQCGRMFHHGHVGTVNYRSASDLLSNSVHNT